MQDYFVGLDIGTSSVKAVAFDLAGHFILKKSQPCKTLSPQAGWAVQDPEVICQGAIRSLSQLVAAMGQVPIGVCFSSAMHSLIALDAQGRTLTPCLLWSDNRAAAIAEKLKGSASGKPIYRHTGTPIHAMSPLVKIAWLREHEPTVFQKTSKFVGIKDYLVFKLFGECVTDFSMASATGLFDHQALDWFGPSLEFAGIAAHQLPRPVPPSFVFDKMRPGVANRLGLSENTPFVIGASDGCLANLGAGALTPGDAVLTIGTSAALRMTFPSATYDPQERIFNYLLTENQYVTGGASNNGAVVYEWFCRQFFGRKPSDKGMARHIVAMQKIPKGAEGLRFLPHILGERAPLWDASATGQFLGIRPRHTLAHFHRAVLEGITENIKRIGEALEEAVCPIQKIRANGGFTKMDFWVQLVADVFQKEVWLSESEEETALGAAIMGMKALGLAVDGADLDRKKEKMRVFVSDFN